MSSSEATVIYPYATGALLDERNTYTYTPYHGRSFLDAWRGDRDRTRAACDPTAIPDVVEGRCLDSWTLPARSADLLVTLRQRIKAGALDPEDDKVLARLVQRFEVTKRVHTAYDATWRATDQSDFRDLGLVVLFAETMADGHAREPRIDVLNVLLKAMDTLCASVESLSPGQQARLAALIDREAAFIAALEAKVADR